MFPEELKHTMGVLEDKDGWQYQISTNKQLKANFQICPGELNHIIVFLDGKDDWKD